MQTKEQILEKHFISDGPLDHDPILSAMDEYAKPAVDALKEIIKMSNAGKILSHIDSSIATVAKEAIKQYNQ